MHSRPVSSSADLRRDELDVCGDALRAGHDLRRIRGRRAMRSESMSEVVLSSSMLEREGFVHGFSTRLGGVSEGPFASMNLARAVGDEPAAVDENYRRFRSILSIDEPALFETSQVHGDVVLRVDAKADVVSTRGAPADALVCRDAGIAVAVRVADCVPILLADPRTGAVAAVHAGWRGTVVRILDRALDELESGGARAGHIVAAIGPHIGPERFEVGDEVALEIAKAAGSDAVIVRGYDKPHIDLERVIRLQLEARGIDPTRIERVPGCTYTDTERFHSFRRDGKRSGRHLAAIVARSHG